MPRVGGKHYPYTAAGKKAGMASRINTMLSIPMLYFMVAQQHAGIMF